MEQITTALIYKFMDDLDKESVELGGEAKFFTGDFEKYSWTKLIDTRLTGEGRLDLYVQAITSMDKNPNLPQLFRDIFKGAFLPYNDPQTLFLFLKEINKFNYGHSEELGNAFEYLLSVLGSQGDAGQFRTPRHIIDFIVEVIDPKKNETILDPACGTAGFLISSYKHIRKQNSSNFKPGKKEESVVGKTAAEAILHDDPVYQGDLLTPRERKKIMKNIQGYDISPDMVRLSLVNLYLHGFPGPKIFEYDTLSSEKRWGETFDVILANPPFMTPKGGIRPHKRFQVQANRSEVLFVDYILEHLNIKGRAGIIVPEGVIFKSENAYKRLRKLLIEDGLFAIVSLPSGVFNPYSGVKTSILMFDNQIAKQADEILFIKIENDGFDLGAQRRKIKKNDLPEALKVIQAWKKGNKQESNFALWVKKEKITKDGDYNLTGERYREVEIYENNNWPVVKLGEVCEINPKKSELENKHISVSFVPMTVVNENYPFFTPKETRRVDEVYKGYTYFRDNDVLLAKITPCFENGKAGIAQDLENGIGFGSTEFIVLRSNGKILPKILYYLVTGPLFREEGKKNMTGSAGQKRVPKRFVSEYKIPLPPLEVQKEIVEQIEVKQAVVDGAKAVVDNLEKERRYFGHELRKMEDIEWVELREVCKFVRGPFGGNLKKEIFVDEGYSVYEQQHAIYGDFNNFRYFVTKEKFEKMKRFEVFSGDILMSCSGTFGRVSIVPEDHSKGIINQALLKLTVNKKLSNKYLALIMQSKIFQDQLSRGTTGGVIKNVSSVKVLKKLRIPLPSLEIQNKLVEVVKKEETITSSNLKLINLMEKKIEKVLERV